MLCHNDKHPDIVWQYPIHLIITSNSDNKVCIPKDITIGTSEEISSDCYNINELTLTARINGIKIDETTRTKSFKLIANPIQKNTDIHSCIDHLSIINQKDDNILSLSLFRYSNAIKRKDNYQIPNPLKD